MTNVNKFKFYLPLRVRFVETDLQGHVFFGNYLIYFDEALTQYMHAIGCTTQDLLAAGVDLFYARSECEYHSRAFFEEVLNIHARVERIGNASIIFEFAASKEANDELVASGKFVAVAIDLQTKKPVRVPEVFREAVEKYEGQ